MDERDVDWSEYDMVIMPGGELVPYNEVVRLAESIKRRFPDRAMV